MSSTIFFIDSLLDKPAQKIFRNLIEKGKFIYDKFLYLLASRIKINNSKVSFCVFMVLNNYEISPNIALFLFKGIKSYKMRTF